MLEDRGWKILRSTTGFDAEAMFIEHGPSLIITNIDMPGGSGLEIIARLRQKRRDISVIAVTRCAEPRPQIRTALVCGADHVLIGPVTTRKLDAALRAVLCPAK